MDSSDPRLFNERGVLYFELGELEKAKSDFVTVLKQIESFSIVLAAVCECFIDGEAAMVHCLLQSVARVSKAGRSGAGQAVSRANRSAWRSSERMNGVLIPGSGLRRISSLSDCFTRWKGRCRKPARTMRKRWSSIPRIRKRRSSSI